MCILESAKKMKKMEKVSCLLQRKSFKGNLVEIIKLKDMKKHSMEFIRAAL